MNPKDLSSSKMWTSKIKLKAETQKRSKASKDMKTDTPRLMCLTVTFTNRVESHAAGISKARVHTDYRETYSFLIVLFIFIAIYHKIVLNRAQNSISHTLTMLKKVIETASASQYVLIWGGVVVDGWPATAKNLADRLQKELRWKMIP